MYSKNKQKKTSMKKYIEYELKGDIKVGMVPATVTGSKHYTNSRFMHQDIYP